MGKGRNQTNQSLSPQEEAILDLVRLGSRGSAPSVVQLARRLLRHKISNNDQFQRELGQLLIGAGQVDRVLRGASAPQVPLDPETRMPLAAIEEAPPLIAPVLNVAEREVIERLVEARLKVDALSEAGLEPPRTCLLTGPPGVGKTMTARYLAASVGLPFITVELSSLMSSLLGKTGQNLRQLLDYARSIPCILLLDEFDAIAKRRDDSSDIGELKRLVNVLLLELDRWPSSGLIVAATNHAHLLDPAAGRRFEVVLEIARPSVDARREILRQLGTSLGMVTSPELLSACALLLDGATGAELEQLMITAARAAVLDGSSIEHSLVATVLRSTEDDDLDRDGRAAFSVLAVEEAGMSHRQVAALLGVSHPTVSKLIGKWHASAGRFEEVASGV